MNSPILSSLSGLDDATMQQKMRELASRYGTVFSLNQITYDTPPQKSFLISFESGNMAKSAAAALGGAMLGSNAIVITLQLLGHHMV